MGHLQIILAVFALAVGVGAVSAMVHIQRQYPLPFSKSLIGFLVPLTLIVVLSLTTHYLKTNIVPENGNSAAWIHLLFRYNFSVTTILLGFLNRAYILMVGSLLGKRFTLSANIGFGLTWTALFAIQTIEAAAGNLALAGVAYTAADYFLTTLIITGGAVVLFLEAKRIPSGGKKSSLLKFARVQLAITLVWLAFRLAYFSGRLTEDYIYIIGQTASILAAQLAVLFFMKRFVAAYAETTRSSVRTEEERTAIYAKYGITPREKEIVRLICEGLSNKEIQDRLFISLQSVKDHVYRIYRKTGARNRVQLVNLFGE